MGEYGYIKKDELMHYGVKGMKWHKHLKSKFNLLTGISQRRDLEDTESMLSYNNYLNKYGLTGSANHNKTVASYKKQIEYRSKKYDSTPLGKIEKSSKIGKKVVNAIFGSVSENASKKTNKKKAAVIRTINTKDSVSKKDVRSRAEKVTTGDGSVKKGKRIYSSTYSRKKNPRKPEQPTYVPVFQAPSSKPKYYNLNWDTIEQTPWLNPAISDSHYSIRKKSYLKKNKNSNRRRQAK